MYEYRGLVYSSACVYVSVCVCVCVVQLIGSQWRLLIYETWGNTVKPWPNADKPCPGPHNYSVLQDPESSGERVQQLESHPAKQEIISSTKYTYNWLMRLYSTPWA